MARFESQKKMGYYVTPDRTLEWLCSLIEPSEEGGDMHILDPCCGEGVALMEVASKLGAYSYGVELDRGRFEESQKRLERAIHCSALDFTCTKESMGLLWLNPPYDWDYRVEGKSRRLEATFYYETIETLAPGGVLVYLVPDYIIDEYLAKSLSYRFDDLKVFKVPRQEYPQFKQVAILGRKRSKGLYDKERTRAFIEEIKTAPFMEDVERVDSYTVLPSAGPRLFRDVNPTTEEMSGELSSTSIWKEVSHQLAPPESMSALSPMMPLSRGHLATLLTAGVMNGVIEKEGEAIVVKGFTRRKKNERRETDDSGRTKVVTVDHTVVSVRYFDGKGSLYNVL